jgi:hypothetical protein
MPASGKGKEISKPELGEAFFASQSDKKDKVSWSPPPPDWIKLNVDAGFDLHSGHACLGFIARNILVRFCSLDGQAINNASRPKKRNV